MKKTICECIAEQLNGLVMKSGAEELKANEFSAETIMQLLETPPEDSMGDLAFPCFGMAKLLRMSPVKIAGELAKIFEQQMNMQQALKQEEGALSEGKKVMETLGIAKVEAVNGYLNIYLDRKGYVENCLKQLEQPDFGLQKSGAGKTVCMDYSSPNIAKNFHVGHLRTTVIGNSLYKIYDKLGWNVVRINYLGDWGTQFGKLIVAYHKWSSKEAVEENGIEELMRIYVKFTEESETDETLIEEARKWFVRMEREDEEALAIWQWFKEISLVEFERVYQLLGMEFDTYSGESLFRSKVPALVEELQKKQLLTESQGAYVIDLSEYDMPPCLILKKDGGSIYHSRDIAALLYRKQEYGFEKCLYVTGMEQALHFKQIFQAIEVMGYDWKEELVHVPYGLVSLQGAKLSSRSGNIIYAEDILKEAMQRALQAVEQKNPDLDNKEAVAQMVGVGAVIFHDLYNQRIKNVDFSWDEVLSFEGTTGPYVQYTYARAKSILRKAAGEVTMKTSEVCEENTVGLECDDENSVKVSGSQKVDNGEICEVLTEGAAYILLKTLMGYADAVERAAQKYEPSVLARYVTDVATAFNRFYHDCPILQAPEMVKEARLKLVKITCNVIADVCGLLGMKCPEEM